MDFQYSFIVDTHGRISSGIFLSLNVLDILKQERRGEARNS